MIFRCLSLLLILSITVSFRRSPVFVSSTVKLIANHFQIHNQERFSTYSRNHPLFSSNPTTSNKKFPVQAMSFVALMISAALPASAIIAPLADVGLKEFLVKDGRQFLRISQPTGKNNAIQLETERDGQYSQNIQESLELIRLRLEQVGVTNPSAWGQVSADEGIAESLIKKNKNDLVDAAMDKDAASSLLNDKIFPELLALADAVRFKNGLDTLDIQEQVASDFSTLRSMQLPLGQLPYEIPDEYSSLPALKGYATVELTVSSKSGFRLADGKKIPKATFLLKLDGYHAPITAGNFVDLVDKKFYDGMSIQKAEQLIVQTGKPKGDKEEGYVDPKTMQLRTLPLELFYKRDKEPVYGITSDDDNRATETMVLPFQAYGAVGMARNNEDVDSASSQFFLLKWSQALIAPGRNTLDGFYTCFGYIVSHNEDLIGQITTADTIESAKVIEGLKYLKR